ncbi:MAG: glycosyltransferase family 39 protein, partial [Anaerolineae bacterium]|nr:glycosyltransferase family 39 protein [Anaerolineae bacterium]
MKCIEHPSRASWLYLLPPLCTAIVVQGFLAASVRFVEYDEAIFLDVARNIARSGAPKRSIGLSGAFFFDHTPMYVYVLGLFAKLSLDHVALLRSITCLFSLASIALVYRIVSAYKDPLAACTAAMILSLSPYYAVYSFHIRMEVPMCTFVLLAGYQIQRWEHDGRRRHLVYAGLSVASAVLGKGIQLIPFLSTSTSNVLELVTGLPAAFFFYFGVVCLFFMILTKYRQVKPAWLGGAFESAGKEFGKPSLAGLGGRLIGFLVVVMVLSFQKEIAETISKAGNLTVFYLPQLLTNAFLALAGIDLAVYVMRFLANTPVLEAAGAAFKLIVLAFIVRMPLGFES